MSPSKSGTDIRLYDLEDETKDQVLINVFRGGMLLRNLSNPADALLSNLPLAQGT